MWCSYLNGVIFTGGLDIRNAYITAVKFIDVCQWRSTEMPSMYKSRGGHAILKYKCVVYIIGGYDNADLVYCEKYDKENWVNIASLNFPLTKLGALVYENNIYASGWTGDRIEKYDFKQDVWT